MKRRFSNVVMSAVAVAAAVLLVVSVAHAADGGSEGESPSMIASLLGNEILALFVIIALGMILGQVRVLGLSLGSSGVMFVALLFGAWGFSVPSQIGTIGLVLFAYCVGITAGPGFFQAFRSQGADLAKLGFLLVAIGGVTTILFALVAGVPADLSAGVLAGAMTSTPALAAAMDVLPAESDVSIGYGIAYPFGIAGIVIFVQLVPRLLKTDLDRESEKIGGGHGGRGGVTRCLIEICNPTVAGKRLGEVRLLERENCQVPRVLRENRMVPITHDTVLEMGMHVLAVGEEPSLTHVTEFLGRKSDREYILDAESERMRVVVTSKGVVGQRLGDLKLLDRFGVTVSRIVRNDVEFVPNSQTGVQRSDILVTVGAPGQLKEFAAFAGHRARAVDETDLISMAVGLTLGIIAGMIPFGLPGSKGFTLGMAGGPLLVALVLGHFGNIGPIRGRIPRASRLLTTEIGLVFFLASAGVSAGGRFVVVLQDNGAVLLLMGALVTLVPMVVGYFFARRVLNLNLLQTLGGICGGMTSTPGLGVITSKTDSDVPTLSYATAYPVALILMTVFAQIVVHVLS